MAFGLAFIFIGVLAMTNAQLLPNCFGIQNGYTFSNPNSANGYYLCQNNVPIPMQCISGFVYCENLSSCCAATQAPVTIPTTTPTPFTIPTTTPTNPPTTTPTTTPATTPATTPTTTTSMPTTTPTTTAATTPSPVNCSNVRNGSLFPNPSSCSGYYMCVNGVAQAGSCLGQFAFNAATGSCSTTKCS